jgi:hypothetical protein
MVFRAKLNEAYDGAIRVLIDAQRFGLGLVAMTLETSASGTVEAMLKFEASGGSSATVVAERLMRHPAVIRVDVVPPAAANDAGASTSLAATGA